MRLSDNERLVTFGIGALMGCLLVGALLSRRNAAKAEKDEQASAPIPSWAQPLPKNVDDKLQQGRILHFKETEADAGKPHSRSWILQFSSDYAFVLIEEVQHSAAGVGDEPVLQYLAADRLVVRLKEGIQIEEFRVRLHVHQLHTREHFRKKGIVIVGLGEIGIGKLEEAMALVREMEIVDSVEYDPIVFPKR